MAWRARCSASRCLLVLGGVCAAEKGSCGVVAKEVENVFLERANKIKAAAAETQMSRVSTPI